MQVGQLMANLSVKSLLDLIKRSKLISEDELAGGFAEFRERHEGDPLDETSQVSAREFADFLIERNLITSWQSEKLLEKKYKGFFVGKYKLLGHLGTGGMSSVYLAEHTIMKRLVAIKVLPKGRIEDSSYLARFYQEAKAAARLDHPNIVRAYDVDNVGDTHYLVMEFVPGRDLQELVRRKEEHREELTAEQAADYIAQAAEGLDHAHEGGLIHRDIKPANLLVDSSDTVKILDMGLALFKNEEVASLTIEHNENVLGTADYLAPEQALNSHNVDRRADIYSLGCTLYFLLTGHAPFNEGTLAQRIAKHQSQMPPDIRIDRPNCPTSLIGICHKMIQKDPDDRYQTAREVADALEEWLASRGHESKSSSRRLAAAAAAGREIAARGASLRPGARDPGSSRGRKPAAELHMHDTVSNEGRATVKGVPPRAPDGEHSDQEEPPPLPPPRKGKSLPVATPLGADSGSGSNVGMKADAERGAASPGAGGSEPGPSFTPSVDGDSPSLLDRRRRPRAGSNMPLWMWLVVGLGFLLVIGVLAILSLFIDSEPANSDAATAPLYPRHAACGQFDGPSIGLCRRRTECDDVRLL